MKRIVAIALVRNEENFVTWALGNVLEFCDELRVIDNLSTDATAEQLQRLAALHPKVRLHRDSNAAGTNSYVQDLIGEEVWVMGVDGDEIFDRAGLARLREKLLGGELDRYWRIQGHTMNALSVSLSDGTATGYQTPAAASATKLYNFGVIESWHANTQRLHGTPVLKSGHRSTDSVKLSEFEPWDAGDYRCLHLCFFPRSRTDDVQTSRLNITDKSFRNVWRRQAYRLLERLGLGDTRLGRYLHARAGAKKLARYVGGNLVQVALPGFGRPTDFTALNPAAGEVEARLHQISEQRSASKSP